MPWYLTCPLLRSGVQGFESVGDLAALAYVFATYEEARQEAGEAVAQAWLSAQTEAAGSVKVSC